MSEEQEKQSAPTNTSEGDIPQSLNLIDSANNAAKRLEEANRKTEELVRRQEEATARMMLSGRANSGQAFKSVQQTQEEQDADEVKKAIARFY